MNLIGRNARRFLFPTQFTEATRETKCIFSAVCRILAASICERFFDYNPILPEKCDWFVDICAKAAIQITNGGLPEIVMWDNACGFWPYKVSKQIKANLETNPTNPL